MPNRACNDCGGPADILHTKAECDGWQRVSAVPQSERDHLWAIAAIIDHAPSSILAAHRLHTDGFLRPPRTAS